MARPGPSVSHAWNVLDNTKTTTFIGEAGKSLRELAPSTSNAFLCKLNGEYVLPEDMDWSPTVGDYVTYIVLPKGGGNASQSILGAIILVVGLVTWQPELMAVGASLLITGLLTVPTFAPLLNSQNSPSPTYDIALSGNSARLGQSIPVPYGRHILTPDFASQPYNTFDSNGDQYYHCLLCLGAMEKFTLESIMIDDTDISHFSSVQTQLIGPQYGTTLSLVDPTVINAPEVATQILTTGTYIGPVSASGPGNQCNKIDIDITAPKGLYLADPSTGNLTPKSAHWFVEARTIDDNGVVTGTWSLLGDETLTGSTNQQIRRSYSYTVPAGRYEVRLQRQDTIDENIRAGHEITWSSLRAHIVVSNPLDPNVNYLAIRILATNQLSGLSQRRMTVIIRRHLRKWNGTSLTGYAESRSLADTLLDICTNPVYSRARPLNTIDLVSLKSLDDEWTARGDTFNAVFDSRITMWQALTTVARAGRARPIMRGNIITFIRDSLQTIPRESYFTRNIKRGSFKIDFTMADADAPDGIELTYFNELKWASDTVTVPMPGIDTPVNPQRASIMGITVQKQALREALYMAAAAYYRTVTCSFVTGLEGQLPGYGDLIAISHDIVGWGSSGDAVYWDNDTKMLECSEELVWGPGTYYATLRDVYGESSGPYRVEPGSDNYTMHFIDSPSIDILTSTDQERTSYAMGLSTTHVMTGKLISMKPSSEGEVAMTVVMEDVRVHSADADVIISGSGDGGRGSYMASGTPVYNASTDDQHENGGYYTKANGQMTDGDPGYTYS